MEKEESLLFYQVYDNFFVAPIDWSAGEDYYVIKYQVSAFKCCQDCVTVSLI